jgi:hypothetical protein
VDLRYITTLLCKPLIVCIFRIEIVVGICLFSLGREFWDTLYVE